MGWRILGQQVALIGGSPAKTGAVMESSPVYPEHTAFSSVFFMLFSYLENTKQDENRS
jgi:hypothetical protein